MNDSSQSANNPASRECAPIALGELSPGDSLETVRRRGTMIATRSARRATGLSWRAVLHKLHLWLGLSISIPLVALGISGSILVYQPEIEALLAGAPPVRTPGSPHPIAEIVAAARSAAPEGVDPVLYLPPRDDRGAAVVRLLQPTRGPRLFDVHVDPVSLEVLQIRSGTRPLRPVFQLHAGLLAGRAGREAVGWLGVMTLGMAASGLVLWWPPPPRLAPRPQCQPRGEGPPALARAPWRARLLVPRALRAGDLHRRPFRLRAADTGGGRSRAAGRRRVEGGAPPRFSRGRGPRDRRRRRGRGGTGGGSRRAALGVSAASPARPGLLRQRPTRGSLARSAHRHGHGRPARWQRCRSSRPGAAPRRGARPRLAGAAP
jgi:hypothetical protein